MKKVGIITFHCADNFGAVLQVYSLQKIVSDLGFKVEVIDFRPYRITGSYSAFPNFKVMLKQNGLINTTKKTIKSLLNFRGNYLRQKNFANFRLNYLNTSAHRYTISEELLKNRPEYDIYITGSDQVWNPSFFADIGNSYFLDFAVKGSRKISYAASIASEVQKENIKNFEQEIKNFDYVSVREKSSKKFIENFTEKEVKVTLDPSLLNTKDMWKEISTFNTKEYKYILVYDLVKSPTLISTANKVAEKYGCKIISYSNSEGYQNWHSTFSSFNPTEFLGLFENAEFVVTSSFHGTAFSIIFNKPFYTIPHPTRGNRMIDLLNELDLSERIVSEKNDLEEINADINYNEVNIKLDELRFKSMSFLKEALNHEEKRNEIS